MRKAVQFAILASSIAPATGIVAQAGTTNLVVSVALVDDEMSVRPVPLHALRLILASGDTVSLRTGVDGTASARVAPGNHRLESVQPQRFQGTLYSWALPLTANAPESKVSLTNDNATTGRQEDAGAGDAARFDMAKGLFERLSSSVFRVEAGLGHGTGFLADTLGGVLITNAHVVEAADSGRIAVNLDSTTRVRAQVLALDADADIAILRIHPEHLESRNRVPLQNPVGRTSVTPGERLVAMGYPLNQDLTITTGIASSIRAGAIISDVNINPGNSGGPLLNSDGEAVAINTFADASGAVGPGVSGSILVSRAGPALARAAVELGRTQPPAPDRLPGIPTTALNVATLKAYADAADVRQYRRMIDIGVAGFAVTIQTPAQVFVARRIYEEEVGKDRKKREAMSNLPEAQRYSEVREVRDWAEYVGLSALPVISFSVRPKVGETGGSVFRRIMLGPGLQATYRFQGDVRGVTIFRDGVPMEPIKGGHVPMSVYEENRWVSLKDVADQGYYVFDAELFRPSNAGEPPSIVIAIADLKNPRKLKCKEFSAETIANAWNDFEVFYSELRPAEGFIPADHRAVRGRRAAQRDILKDECDWSY